MAITVPEYIPFNYKMTKGNSQEIFCCVAVWEAVSWETYRKRLVGRNEEQEKIGWMTGKGWMKGNPLPRESCTGWPCSWANRIYHSCPSQTDEGFIQQWGILSCWWKEGDDVRGLCSILWFTSNISVYRCSWWKLIRWCTSTKGFAVKWQLWRFPTDKQRSQAIESHRS